MKSEIDLSDVSNCFSSQGIYIRSENIDREKKKEKGNNLLSKLYTSIYITRDDKYRVRGIWWIDVFRR